ncbi:cyclic nucleotide-binding domain-containing protein [Desulfopila inferna]|uniref:cyclic nucleotide-binding domain-containing protein n=1 Tax=Desulfopila inferna TaxID=468528 RepID=UPI001965F5A9|nr:cyclic nucleotide-binding domain-containing protein [Desulfopila inferna]MBM9602933.1 cyclic nucleotide-binding domain-containing protein [Desulfopila inferna]
MHTNTLHNDDAKQKAFRLLEEAERKRALLRFEHGLEDLQRGRLDILRNNEFTGKLPPYLFEWYKNTTEKEKPELILECLFSNLSDARHGAVAQAILGEVCKCSLKECNIRLMQFLCSLYVSELEKNQGECRITADMAEFFVKSCWIFAHSNLWQDFDNIISLLWELRNTSYTDSSGGSVPVFLIFSDIAAKDILESILRMYSYGNELQKISAARHLHCLGDNAMVYLLNRLVFSNSEREHFLLIGLIAGFGENLVRPLNAFIEMDLSWYSVKNLIVLIGEMGNPDYYRMIEGYLAHPDIRIQQQVVSCIARLGGKTIEKRLSQALPVVADEVKLKLIMQLSVYGSEETADGLIDLINTRSALSVAMRQELLYAACITLRSYPYDKVIQLLRQLSGESDHSPKLYRTLKETINYLEPCIRHRKKEQAESEVLSYGLELHGKARESERIDGFLEKLEIMLRAGKVEEASSLVYKKIVDLSRKKDFQAAEMLRDKLLDINPDALPDVIRAAEIIEEEKNLPVSGLQLELWEELLRSLSDCESDHLLSSWRNEDYHKDEKIVSAGEIDPCLYFLNEGSVQLSCRSGRDETFLKRLKPGDVIGLDPFFSASVWTVNIKALKYSRMQVLRRDIFMSAAEVADHLEKKLFEFCRARNSVPELVRISGSDRRDCARYISRIPVKNILLDPYGNSGGRRAFQGEMMDISRGGFSFSIRISNRENAHLMLGRQIISKFNSTGKETIACFGLVVGVYCRQERAQEFSVHVKFYTELEQYQLTDVLNPAN